MRPTPARAVNLGCKMNEALHAPVEKRRRRYETPRTRNNRGNEGAQNVDQRQLLRFHRHAQEQDAGNVRRTVAPPRRGKVKHRPFHSYTMKQAIEEGFILDVLENYTPVSSYYKLIKKTEDDPEFDTKKAKKSCGVRESHDHAIRLKAGISGAVQQIITDPTRGSHDAYAVTSTASTTWPTRSPRPATHADLGQHHRQPPEPGLHHLRPELRPDDRPQLEPYDLATGSPRSRPTGDTPSPTTRRPQPGIPPGPVRRRQLGRVQSPDNGKTWALFPTRPSAPSPGGDLPHVSVSALSLSQGNIDPNTGMPDLAGPYNPASQPPPRPTPTC